MGLVEDTLTEGLGSTVAIGAAAILLGPALLPVVGGLLKPVAKAVIKGGLMVYYQGGKLVAETRETMGDLVAESRSELTPAEKRSTGTGGVEHHGAAPVAESRIETEGGAV